MMHRHAVRWVGIMSLVVVAARHSAAWGQCETGWLPGDPIPGLNGIAYAATNWDPDGAGPQPAMLIVGGEFSFAGDTIASGVAGWDGARWSAFEVGVGGSPSTIVRALTVFDDGSGPAVYVGGFFLLAGSVPASCVARWDGTHWTAAGTLGDTVRAFAVHDDGSGSALYAGGSFGGHVAKWDGTNWLPAGAGMNGDVLALASFDDGSGPVLYSGGPSRIAKWDGVIWTDLSNSIDADVNALAVYNDGLSGAAALYAGGNFQTIDGLAVNRIARWDGVAWSALGAGTTSTVSALTVVEEGAERFLYVGGGFSTAGGISSPRVAKWDGSGWLAVGTGLSGTVRALASVHGPVPGAPATVYAAGAIPTASGHPAGNLARLDGTIWSALNTRALDETVSAMTMFDDGSGLALYVAGEFDVANGGPGNGVAKWDGANWSTLGSGCNNSVRALITFDDGSGPALYAGGSFTSPGSRVAKWDGTSWSALGTGLNDTVWDLAVFDNGNGPTVYAGGEFTRAGSQTASRVARWNGTNWSPVGNELPCCVYALAGFDDGSGPALFAGGSMTSLGRIVRLDVITWRTVATGVDGTVYDLSVFDHGNGPVLYAGGSFRNSAGMPIKAIARLNGLHWSPVGGGLGIGTVRRLSVLDDGNGELLYVGGSFSMANGAPANQLARWDGQFWQAVGNGIDGGTLPTIRAIQTFDDAAGAVLHVGGTFQTVGEFVSPYLARWRLRCATVGDLDCDGTLNLLDIDPFILAVLDPAAYFAAFPACDILYGDLDGSGAVNFLDIDPFVACLFGTCP